MYILLLLLSFSMMILRFIHVVVYITDHCFLLLSTTPLYEHSVYPFTYWWIWVASTLGIWWIKLLWTFMRMSLWSFLLSKYPGVECLGGLIRVGLTWINCIRIFQTDFLHSHQQMSILVGPHPNQHSMSVFLL